jgi:hypothetical protein
MRQYVELKQQMEFVLACIILIPLSITIGCIGGWILARPDEAKIILTKCKNFLRKDK